RSGPRSRSWPRSWPPTGRDSLPGRAASNATRSPTRISVDFAPHCGYGRRGQGRREGNHDDAPTVHRGDAIDRTLPDFLGAGRQFSRAIPPRPRNCRGGGRVRRQSRRSLSSLPHQSIASLAANCHRHALIALATLCRTAILRHRRGAVMKTWFGGTIVGMLGASLLVAAFWRSDSSPIPSQTIIAVEAKPTSEPAAPALLPEVVEVADTNSLLDPPIISSIEPVPSGATLIRVGYDEPIPPAANKQHVELRPIPKAVD